MKKRQIFSFHLIRNFACLWIIAVHISSNINLPGPVIKFMEAGSSGVILFFVLSGYFIFESLENNSQKQGSILTWYGKRLVRILPAYYVVIFMYFVLYVLILKSVPHDETGLGWTRYLFCINQIIPAHNEFWSNLGATWTVSVFLFFYLLAPILFRLIRKLPVAYIALVGFYLLARIADVYFKTWFRPMIYLYYFMIGIAVFLALKEKQEKQFTTICIILLLVLTVFDSSGGLKIGILTGMLMISAAEINCAKQCISRAITKFSEYTYTIYLVHYLMLTYVFELTNLQGIGLLIVFTVGTFIMSWLIHQWIEIPAKKLAVK